MYATRKVKTPGGKPRERPPLSELSGPTRTRSSMLYHSRCSLKWPFQEARGLRGSSAHVRGRGRASWVVFSTKVLSYVGLWVLHNVEVFAGLSLEEVLHQSGGGGYGCSVLHGASRKSER